MLACVGFGLEPEHRGNPGFRYLTYIGIQCLALDITSGNSYTIKQTQRVLFQVHYATEKKKKKSFVKSSVVLSTVNYEHLEKNPVKAQLTSFLSLYSNDRLM